MKKGLVAALLWLLAGCYPLPYARAQFVDYSSAEGRRQNLEALRSKQAAKRTPALHLLTFGLGRETLRAWDPEKHPEKLTAEALRRSSREAVRKSPLQIYLKPVMDLYIRTADDRDNEALLVLAQFESPRVTEFLAERLEQGQGGNLGSTLQRACAEDTPPPALLRALQSPDVLIRREAATALAQSGSSLLIPYIRQAAKDSDVEVRISASVMGRSLSGKDWEQVRPAVLALLSDPFGEVRGRVAGIIVYKEGVKMAGDLLRLIQDIGLPKGAHWYVCEAMRQMAGQDFGYRITHYSGPEDTWQPTTPENRAAIARFAAWVKMKPL